MTYATITATQECFDKLPRAERTQKFEPLKALLKRLRLTR